MTNSHFRIVALPTAVAEQARLAAKSGERDHAVVEVDSPGAYPCRHCLRWAQPGERVVLFSFASIPSGHPYSESGPIFVHEQPCPRYTAEDEYPADFREGRVLRGYDSHFQMIDAIVVNGDKPETVIESLLADPQIAFLQARSVTRGCFTFKIERL